jgi:hypothetical protein
LAISQLFQLYESWLLPKFEASHTCLPVQVGTNSHLICLSPVIDIQGAIKLPALSQWRLAFEFFTANQLQYTPPQDGFFFANTPPCFKPAATTSSQPSHYTNVSDNQSVAISAITMNTRNTSVSNRSHDSRLYNCSQDTRSHGHHNQIVTHIHKVSQLATALKPVFQFSLVWAQIQTLLDHYVHSLMKSIINCAGVINCKPPCAPLPGGEDNTCPICFRFCSANGPGCPTRSSCYFHHIDLADQQWFRTNVPRQFCCDLRNFLNDPAMKPHYSATPEFPSFLRSSL